MFSVWTCFGFLCRSRGSRSGDVLYLDALLMYPAECTGMQENIMNLFTVTAGLRGGINAEMRQKKNKSDVLNLVTPIGARG